MGFFFVYILKSGVCLSLFYLFYRLLLSKETFYRFNRIALLGILVFSLLLPLIEVTKAPQNEINQAVLTIEQLLVMAENHQETQVTTVVEGDDLVDTWRSPVHWIEIVLLFYIAGIFFLVCRNVYSLFRLVRLMNTAQRRQIDKHTVLLVHDRNVAPFSWMKFVVISRTDLEENGREILIHECAHIRKHHSWDLLIADICIFFQWFNPGAWLLKQELQNIHEYEADEAVINEGINARDYQLLLIKKAVGTRLYSMANIFNHSKIKKRITMMLKEKSNPWARLKYLYVLPLAAIAVTAFARPEISEKADEVSAVKVNDLANFMQENVLGDTIKVLKDTVKVSESEKKEETGIGGRVSEDNEVVIFEVVEQMPEFPGGTAALSKYLKDKTESSSAKGKAGGSVTVGFTVAKTGKVENVKASPSDQSILSKEAERIVREMPDWIPGKQRGMPVPVKYSVSVRFGDIRFQENKKPLILVDGRETSMDAFDKMDKGVIESVSVLKDSASIRLYGKRGTNGVILVSTQKTGKLDNDMKAVAFIEKETVETNTAEEIAVTGTVVDEQRRPKAGVSVVVPNTNIGTMTDANGRFQLKTQNRGSIWFSFIGYKTVKAPVSPTMSVQLEQEVVRLFPETSGKLKASATLSSDVKGIRGLSIHGIKDGEPPLVIIDGKEALEEDALSKLSPDRIKSFSILKDKSAKTVYGEKGKNGVIIVTLLTEGEYDFQKANPKKPYADALELAESVAKDVEGEIIYCIDDEEVRKTKLKGMSTKAIRTVSLDHFDKKKIVRLKTEKYRSDWIPVVGVVKDADGKRTAALIKVKGANDITRTNTDGSFAIKAPKNGVLLVGDNNRSTIEVKVKPMLEVIFKD